MRLRTGVILSLTLLGSLLFVLAAPTWRTKTVAAGYSCIALAYVYAKLTDPTRY